MATGSLEAPRTVCRILWASLSKGYGPWRVVVLASVGPSKRWQYPLFYHWSCFMIMAALMGFFARTPVWHWDAIIRKDQTSPFPHHLSRSNREGQMNKKMTSCFKISVILNLLEGVCFTGSYGAVLRSVSNFYYFFISLRILMCNIMTYISQWCITTMLPS